MTQVKISLNNPQDAQSAVNAVLKVQIKLGKIVEALQHTNAAPNYKYLINYLVEGSGVSVIVSSRQLSEECDQLGSRLAEANVQELVAEGSYAEIGQATLGYMIEEKMRGDRLVINGSEIRYKTKKQDKQWQYLKDSVQIIVTKMELTDEDRAEFRQRQLQEALDAVAKMGYSIDADGSLVVI